MTDHDDVKSSDSTDADVTYRLIETLVDGQKGFADLAEKLADDGHAALATTCRQLSAKRKAMADELRTMAKRYGDVVDSDGSMKAAAHRGWMSLKDALTGNDADALFGAAGTGEDYAVEQYEDALGQDISADLRGTVERQLGEIRETRASVDAMST